MSFKKHRCEGDVAKYFLYLIQITSIFNAGEGKKMLKGKTMSIHYEVKCSTGNSGDLSEFHISLTKQTLFL